MAGLDGWHYDYQCTMVDEAKGMVLGFWKQRSGITDDATGQEYEILGIGGSWFGVERARPDGSAEVRAGSATGSTSARPRTTFLAIAGSGKAPQGLLDRMRVNGKEQPGHYTYDELPVDAVAAAGRARRVHHAGEPRP